METNQYLGKAGWETVLILRCGRGFYLHTYFNEPLTGRQ